eukprot:CAMPEP_0198141072 /NCGR_PEP_ID=MMETSP1443-20131203/4140_1 /TAXON_ID=186043 /ORGANISM="Entomoneis sp., Strain CCMP2396" /LENGTH=453 /DNA_ID=CAMNT_0043803687 /DNA_START=188 /DNA_END=1549 /DNA_ORIENTATION=+
MTSPALGVGGRNANRIRTGAARLLVGRTLCMQSRAGSLQKSPFQASMLSTVSSQATASMTAPQSSLHTLPAVGAIQSDRRGSGWRRYRQQSWTDEIFTTMATMAIGGVLISAHSNQQQQASRVTYCEADEPSLKPTPAITHQPSEEEAVVDGDKVEKAEEEAVVDGGKAEKEDPYENLPEEDEPTDCSMCNTFRQGPCRTPWRKLERCFKDHEDEENGAVKCVDYFMPHQECLMNYTNLYMLVGNEMKQELIKDVEIAFDEDEKPAMPMPEIDWSLYLEFLQENGPTFRQTEPNLDKSTPLWKRFPPDTEPVLISLDTHLPSVDKKSGWILKVAYVLDQDEKVIGFQYSEGYGNLLKLSKGSDNEDSTDPEKKKLTLDESVKLGFFVIPSETKHIQIKAYYAENPVDANPEKDILDGCIKESPLHAIPTMSDIPKKKKKRKETAVTATTEEEA